MDQSEKDDRLILAVPIQLTPTVREFVLELEQKMLKGSSSQVCASWAKEHYGLNEEEFKKMEALVLHIWSEGGVRVENFIEKRDKHRARYTDLYVKALESGKLGVALRALDAMSRMDGFDAPQQINI